MKNNRGVELSNSGSLKSTVELGVQSVEYENALWKNQLWNWAFILWKYENPLWTIVEEYENKELHCGQLWTSRSPFHSSTNHPTVELWKNIS